MFKFLKRFFKSSVSVSVIDEQNIIDKILKYSCNVDMIFKVATDIVTENNSKSSQRDINVNKILELCFKKGYIKINLGIIAQFIHVYNYLPDRWAIDEAIKSNEQVPQSTYYGLSKYSYIMVEVFEDLNRNPDKYKNLPTSELYDSIEHFRVNDYDWKYYMTILIEHRPDSTHFRKLIEDRDFHNFSQNLIDLFAGVAVTGETASSVVRAFNLMKPDTKRSRENIKIDIQESKCETWPIDGLVNGEAVYEVNCTGDAYSTSEEKDSIQTDNQ